MFVLCVLIFSLFVWTQKDVKRKEKKVKSCCLNIFVLGFIWGFFFLSSIFMCYRQWRIKTDLATHSHFAMTLLRCLLWTVAHWRPLLVGKVTSSYWVCVLGWGGGRKRPRRRRWRRNRTAMKHQTVSSSGAAERDLWPQAVQSIKHLLFILQCSRTGRGRILEEEGGARGALRITVNVFGESFWETQEKNHADYLSG